MTAAYLAAVAWITLSPAPYDDETGETLERILTALAGFPPTAWITFDVVEFTANIVMFAPLGVLVVLWFGARRWWLAVFVGLMLSGSIEATQLVFLDSRVADVRDLVANTLGSTLGALAMLGVARAAAARRQKVAPAP